MKTKNQIMMKCGFGTLTNDVWTMKNSVLTTKANEMKTFKTHQTYMFPQII